MSDHQEQIPSNADDAVPTKFVCPLTLELMTDPLMSKYGHNFSRDAILEWLGTGNDTCPLTRKPLAPSNLIPNASLRLEIRSWQRDNGLEVTCTEKKPDVHQKLVLTVMDESSKKQKTRVCRFRSSIRSAVGGTSRASRTN